MKSLPKIFLGFLLAVFMISPIKGSSNNIVKNIRPAVLDTPPPLGIICYPPPRTTKPKYEIFDTPEIPPSYIGGHDALKKYLSNKIDSLELKPYYNLLPQKVYAEMIIDTLGKPKNIKIIKGGLDSSFNQKVIKIIEEMPNWKPGELRGKPVETRMIMPLKFNRKEE